QLVGDVDEAQGAEDDQEQIPESSDSSGVVGCPHVVSIRIPQAEVLFEKGRGSRRQGARAPSSPRDFLSIQLSKNPVPRRLPVRSTTEDSPGGGIPPCN